MDFFNNISNFFKSIPNGIINLVSSFFGAFFAFLSSYFLDKRKRNEDKKDNKKIQQKEWLNKLIVDALKVDSQYYEREVSNYVSFNKHKTNDIDSIAHNSSLYNKTLHRLIELKSNFIQKGYYSDPNSELNIPLEFRYPFLKNPNLVNDYVISGRKKAKEAKRPLQRNQSPERAFLFH